MGQAQSDEYRCGDSNDDNSNNNNSEATEDVADLEINSIKELDGLEESRKYGGQKLRQQQQQQKGSKCSATNFKEQQQRQRQHQNHVRKLSIVSNRNIQLLSMKPRSEKDAYADNLRSRRRSSLINLILGAPSSGPKFCDDLCSLSSHISEGNFGIEFFPDIYHHTNISSMSSLRLESSSLEGDLERGAAARGAGDGLRGWQGQSQQHRRRRSSLGSTLAAVAAIEDGGGTIGGRTAAEGRHEGSRGLEGVGNGFVGQQQDRKLAPSAINHQGRYQQFSRPSLASTLASIDLTSSFEQHDKSSQAPFYPRPPPRYKTKQTIFESNGGSDLSPPAHLGLGQDLKSRASRGRVNQGGRVLRRSGSELSLYSTISASSYHSSYTTDGSKGPRQSLNCSGSGNGNGSSKQVEDLVRSETKLIIILQVCLPFILAGFGNMAAGLVLNCVAQWRAFQKVPIFFVLLPPFIGLKGNIEMTLASRLSTLSNLNLLDTTHQRVRAYESNLVLILSQAIGLSVFATIVSTLCEYLVFGTGSGGGGGASHVGLESNGAEALELFETSILVVLASALVTSVILVFASSIIVSLAVGLANLIQVNPDNLSTLIAALYGDVSCVLVYGLVAEWMFSLREQHNIVWPIFTISCALVSWPILLFAAYKFKETHRIAISSIPPMLASIMVSIGSGAVLSLVIGKFKLIALYQPVVNGFGANLIAVQASRVSTWLWCHALRDASTASESNAATLPPAKTLDSLATFTSPPLKSAELVQRSGKGDQTKGDSNGSDKIELRGLMLKLIRKPLWSFCNSSPNSVAARLLLLMLIPAHTIYFFVIWLLAPQNHVTLTWHFYFVYIFLCVLQVFILLTICEPLMTLLMRRNLDPDIFGISLLMALADLIGTLCLTGAFFTLAALDDPNAL